MILKLEGVNRFARRGEDVRLSLRDKQTGQPAVGKRLPDPGHMAVKGLDRGPGWIFAPHRVNQPGLPERPTVG
jgi:hypothetical protein